MIEGLRPRLAVALPSVDVLDADPGTDPQRPSVWITDGGQAIGGRAVCGGARSDYHAALLVCSSTSALGASRLAADVAALLDGALHAGGMLTVDAVSGAAEDRTDPTAYAWSATVTVSQTLPHRSEPLP